MTVTSTSTIHTGKKMFCIKTSFLLFMLLWVNIGFAQYTLHINITSLPGTHSADTVFIAGNFNSWDPGNVNYKLTKTRTANNTDLLSIDIAGLQGGIYEFKFTRGHWDKAEATADGKSISNRIIKLESDSTIECSIEAWTDDFAQAAKPHTASSNVHVMDTVFFMPQLYRTRKIWIYLPPDYSTSKKKYPVLYMHDGQNLFDEYTSGYGEWGVDECLDSIIKKGKPGCIVVGIDNGPKRMNEYNPYEFSDHGPGEGDAYILFLVETLKPYIDKHYRTMSSRENTFIAGSSMGGLISYYAMLRYPDVFGKAGIFSASFWIAPQVNELTDLLAGKSKGQFFFYAGEMEDSSMVPNMKMIAEKLAENSSTLIYTVTDPEGRHNEAAWRKWFEEFYLWITGNGLSYQIKTKD